MQKHYWKFTNREGLPHLVIQTVIFARNIIVVKGIVKFAIKKRVTVDSCHYFLMKEILFYYRLVLEINKNS
jgi:hypothetical protein